MDSKWLHVNKFKKIFFYKLQCQLHIYSHWLYTKFQGYAGWRMLETNQATHPTTIKILNALFYSRFRDQEKAVISLAFHVT